MSLGMEMMLKSLGIDPEAITSQAQAAMDHVKLINERLLKIEEMQALNNGILHRIEGMLEARLEDRPGTTEGFIALAEQQQKHPIDIDAEAFFNGR
jgi:hypothetical protein